MPRTCLLALLLVGLISSVPAQVQSWVFDFETPGLLPQDATVDLQFESQNGPAGNGSPSPMGQVTGGVLQQRMTLASSGFTGGRGTYYGGYQAAGFDPWVTPVVLDATADLMIEARIQFHTFESGATSALLLAEDGVGRFGIWFGPNAIQTLGSNVSIAWSSIAAGFDPTQWHEYRVESDGGSMAMRVFVDGALVWTGAGVGGTRNAFSWGDGSSLAGSDCDCDWTWVRIANGPGLFSSPPQWQVNQPGASAALGSGTSNAHAPLRRTACVGASIGFVLDSVNVGLPWDLVVTAPEPGVAASSGGLTLFDGQIVNIDVAAPSFFALNGLAFSLPWPGPIMLPISFSFPVSLATQLVVIDPAQATGLSLSALNELAVSNGGIQTGLASQDDKSTIVPIMAPPLCSPTPITFAGQQYTQISVSSNGKITFGATDNAWTPTVTTFAANPAVAGLWTDFDNRNVGGQNDIQVSQALGVIRVSWINVPSWGQPGSATSFDVVFDLSQGSTVIENYVPNPLHGTASLTGLSPGGPAVDPGGVSFLGAVGQINANFPNEMVYELTPGASVPAGWNQINFLFSDPTAWAVN